MLLPPHHDFEFADRERQIESSFASSVPRSVAVGHDESSDERVPGPESVTGRSRDLLNKIA
jgi:hypothetical protein